MTAIASPRDSISLLMVVLVPLAVATDFVSSCVNQQALEGHGQSLGIAGVQF
jgi:hypothetical protein